MPILLLQSEEQNIFFSVLLPSLYSIRLLEHSIEVVVVAFRLQALTLTSTVLFLRLDFLHEYFYRNTSNMTKQYDWPVDMVEKNTDEIDKLDFELITSIQGL